MDNSISIIPKRFALILFFILVFTLSWLVWLPAALAAAGRLAFPVEAGWLLGAWAPSLVGLVLTLVYHGPAGLKNLLKRLFVLRVGLRWYAFVLLWPALLSLIVTGIGIIVGQPAPDFSQPPVVTAYPLPPELMGGGFLLMLPMVFLIQVFGSSLGEEIGWRGFALPRLQSTRSSLSAGLLLGILWGLWHFPRSWLPGQAFDFAAFGWLVFSLALNGVIYAWIFNQTRGSLAPVILLHTSQAVTGLFLAQIKIPLVENLVILLLVVIIVRVCGAQRLNRGFISMEQSRMQTA